MNKCRWAIGGILALMLLCSVPSSPAAEDKTPADAKTGADTSAGGEVFKLQEVSIFDQKDNAELLQMSMYGGMIGSPCTTEPAKEVKAYPKLNSKRPLYGTINLPGDPGKPDNVMKFYFVLDESGTTEKPAEQEGEEAKYDRLYVDANRDLDLANDTAVSLMKNPPAGIAARFGGSSDNSWVFDTVSLSLGDDPKSTGQSARLLPILRTYGKSFGPVPLGSTWQMTFLPASAWQGEIKLGKKAYKATLMQHGKALSRFDQPSSPLLLTPVDGPKRQRFSFWMNTLGMIREAGGEFYTLTATPSGDQLTVKPFAGERGVLEVSAGKRDIKELGLAGVLQSKNSMLPLGDFSYPLPAERSKVAKYRLPVGDYQPMILNVDFGPLRVELRADYRRAAGKDKPASAIEIRKDKPYILDFNEKAEMQLQGPPKDKVYKPGDQIRFAAMLAIPEKGLLVGGLDDTTKKEGEMKWMAEDGKQMSSPRYASLVPSVAITDSSGKKLAEGKMPFG